MMIGDEKDGKLRWHKDFHSKIRGLRAPAMSPVEIGPCPSLWPGKYAKCERLKEGLDRVYVRVNDGVNDESRRVPAERKISKT